jgi:hypothetical protein
MTHDYSTLFKTAFLLIFPKSNSMVTGRRKTFRKRNREQYFHRFYRPDRAQAPGRLQRKTDFISIAISIWKPKSHFTIGLASQLTLGFIRQSGLDTTLEVIASIAFQP